jgi:hypothetical protein
MKPLPTECLAKPSYYRWKEKVIDELKIHISKKLENRDEFPLQTIYNHAYDTWAIGKTMVNRIIENISTVVVDGDMLTKKNRLKNNKQ